jgi:transcription initiation factor IIE alpha subunit
MKSLKMLMMATLTILSVAVLAQDTTTKKIKAPKQKTEKVKYSCPMHSDITSNKPGKCTKCGMDLTLSPKEKMKMEVMKTYTCPMHPDETSDKSGKCSKCGMDLKETEKTVKAYSCPMHSDVTSANPGKCTKCGMDLTLSPKENMKMEVMKIYTCPMHPDVTSNKPGKCSKCNMDLKEKKEDHSNHQH